MVIYLTTNLINGKKYIGLDSYNRPWYLGSGTVLKKAIVKYGKSNFKKEILEKCSTIEELRERELYWINKFQAHTNPEFYNRTATLTPTEHRRGKPLSEEHKAKISKANKGRKLPPVSEESNKKRSQSLKGHTTSEETRKKISEAQKGIKKSEEAKRKMSLTQSGKPRMNRRKTILQLDKETGEILEEYSGLCSVEAAGFNRYLIQNTCTRSQKKGKAYTSQGYKWLYKE
jgi:group I intron endonuclease